MKIKNDTKNKLVIYLGHERDEEPEMVKTLLVGESMDVDEDVTGLVSIQEK